VIYVVDREVLYEDKFVAVGGSVTIPCHGSTSTSVMWQYLSPAKLNAADVYDGHRLIGDYVNKCTINSLTHDLTIHNVEVDDAGQYWCFEGEGFGVRHITKLFVAGKIATVVV